MAVLTLNAIDRDGTVRRLALTGTSAHPTAGLYCDFAADDAQIRANRETWQHAGPRLSRPAACQYPSPVAGSAAGPGPPFRW